MLYNEKVSLRRILMVKIHENWTAHLRFDGVHGGNWYAIPLQLSGNLKYIEQAFIWAHKWAITTIFPRVISTYFFSINMDTLLDLTHLLDAHLEKVTISPHLWWLLTKCFLHDFRFGVHKRFPCRQQPLYSFNPVLCLVMPLRWSALRKPNITPS